MGPEVYVLGGLWFIVFLLSTTMHEAAHALAAKLGGDSTAANAGQVSMNPMPHIQREPMGMVAIPLISYFLFYDDLTGGWMLGWASAPYDLRWRLRYPKRAAWMALAGPGANLVLAVIAFVLLVIGLSAGAFDFPTSGFRLDRLVVAPEEGMMGGFATFLSILFALNIVLLTFNMMPVPPLDGSTALGLFLPPDQARRWAHLSLQPTFAMISLLAAWFLFPRLVILPALKFGIGLLHSFA